MGGEVFGRDVGVDGASIDSRSIRPGQLFVPIVDERDGHDFIGVAVAGRGSGLPDQRTARGGHRDPRCGHRRPPCSTSAATRGPALPDRVVGITGSVGKTSTKDLLAAVLSASYVTAANERSFNNELGVPLTLVDAPEGTEATVVEMGARGVGPHRAAVRRRPADDRRRHRRGRCPPRAVRHASTTWPRAKGELVEALPADGTAVLNADDERVAAMAARTDARVLTFGSTRRRGAGRGRRRSTTTLRPSFRLRTPWGDADVRLAVRGGHQVANALAAAAAGLAARRDARRASSPALAGAELSGPADGARHAGRPAPACSTTPTTPTRRRWPPPSTPSPRSRRSRRVAVLGTMAELGPDAAVGTTRGGGPAADLGIRLIAVAEPAYGSRAGRGGRHRRRAAPGWARWTTATPCW